METPLLICLQCPCCVGNGGLLSVFFKPVERIFRNVSSVLFLKYSYLQREHNSHGHKYIKRVIGCYNCFLVHTGCEETTFLCNFNRMDGDQNPQSSICAKMHSTVLKADMRLHQSKFAKSIRYLLNFIFCTECHVNQSYCGAQFISDFLRMNCYQASETFNQLG